MKNLRQQKAIRIVAALALTLALASFAIPAQAQTFKSLHTFGGVDGTPPDGSYPNGLVQGTNGYLYGTTFSGSSLGNNINGIVFKISTGGTETVLDNFWAEGPLTGNQAALVLATNGDFYGTTTSNGALYRVTASGAFDDLYAFCATGLPDCADGASPGATLVQASNGDLYGTTQGGGGAYGQGTIFKITTGGTLTTLHSFCETQNSEGNCLDGNGPYTALVQGTNGILYGATHVGGANGEGTIFQITEAGKFSTLYTFCNVSGCPDGAHPYATLVQGSDGNLYGTTGSDGTGAFGGGGTFFAMTPGGKLTTLYSFCSLELPYGADAGHRWELLRDDGSRWGQQPWHDLPNHPQRRADHGAQLRRHRRHRLRRLPTWTVAHPGYQWDVLRGDSRGRGQLPKLRHLQRHRFQLVHGPRPIRGNPADLRQSRVGGQNPGKQSDGRDQGYL